MNGVFLVQLLSKVGARLVALSTPRAACRWSSGARARGVAQDPQSHTAWVHSTTAHSSQVGLDGALPHAGLSFLIVQEGKHLLLKKEKRKKVQGSCPNVWGWEETGERVYHLRQSKKWGWGLLAPGRA